MLDRILGSIAKKPTIGVVGIASWDSVLAVERFPDSGGFVMVTSALELPGGNSANAAAAAAALGAQVELSVRSATIRLGNGCSKRCPLPASTALVYGSIPICQRIKQRSFPRQFPPIARS